MSFNQVSLEDQKSLEQILRNIGVNLPMFYGWVRASGIKHADFIAAAIVGAWKSLSKKRYTDFRMQVVWQLLDGAHIFDDDQRQKIWHAARYIEDCSNGETSMHVAFLAI